MEYYISAHIFSHFLKHWPFILQFYLLYQNGESSLHTACNYGHTSTVEYLTSIHTNLDAQDIVSLFYCMYIIIFVQFLTLLSHLLKLLIFTYYVLFSTKILVCMLRLGMDFQRLFDYYARQKQIYIWLTR